jgi:hypothetical protein
MAAAYKTVSVPGTGAVAGSRGCQPSGTWRRAERDPATAERLPTRPFCDSQIIGYLGYGYCPDGANAAVGAVWPFNAPWRLSCSMHSRTPVGGPAVSKPVPTSVLASSGGVPPQRSVAPCCCGAPGRTKQEPLLPRALGIAPPVRGGYLGPKSDTSSCQRWVFGNPALVTTAARMGGDL